MEIYINGRFLTQSITGVQRVAEEIVKQLDVSLGENENYRFILVTPKTNKRKIKLTNIEIKEIGYFKGHLWEQLDLPRFVKRNMLINFCNTGPILKRNQVVYIHDTAVLDAPEGFSNRFIMVYRILYKILSQRAKKIITVSKYSKDRLINYYPVLKNKVSYAHLGIEHLENVNNQKLTDTLNKYNLREKKYYLAVSSMNPNKNFKLISEMLNKMPLKYDVALVGSKNNVFKQENISSHHIKTLGYVEDEELMALYKGAKAFIFPSKFEGFGLPPIEAMFFNCPPIVSDISPLREILEDQAIYFNPNDYNDLYAKLNTVQDNEEFSDFVVNKYSWKNTSDHLKYILSQL
ncbi:hypothetical protein GZ22_15720 [Terribacillus saccharophilus]|uniref:Glycosyl transferase family 1 domain-containing protein n=1 Tax=Terribacillus saccharophilus TaxID=361277 RepID=A0A075LP85_9BACI|nr:glycosyltransferase family 1 protein [Terribacillus goriensis]AIF67936.1 hypothetical protein GZ22_15720 [Terribacillus goriensis]